MIQQSGGHRVVKVDAGEHNFYLDGYLKSNLDCVKKDVRKDYDAFIIVTGREGYGKSTLASQMAMYLDPTYNIKRCAFTPEQFTQACEGAEKYQAVVFDETMGYLSARGAMSRFNRDLIKVMSEMRSKNLFVIICIPNFFELDKYPAIHRSTGLIHINERSKFMSYNYSKKKKLYLKGKKFYAYNVSPTFIGRFVKYFPLNKEEYEAKKQKAISLSNTLKDREKILQGQRNDLIKYLYEKNIATNVEIADVIGLEKSNIGKILREMGVEEKLSGI